MTSPLFSPFTLGGLTLANRFAMAPMTRNASPHGCPGEDVAAYYARRAAARVGLLITEGTYIDHTSAGTQADVPRVEEGAAAAGWRAVVAAVHAHDAPIFAQLWHLGAEREPGSPPFPDGEVLSPSAVTVAGEARGRSATSSDIDDLVAAYARSARLARELGFDGVEIHAAHGYLLDQFLWAPTNRRTDGYGGSAAARARLSAEVVAAVRAEVGPGYPISFRFSQWKVHRYDARIAATPAELQDLLAPIVDAGVTLFHASTRRFWEPAFEGSSLGLAGWTRKVTGTATMTVGSVGLAGAFDPVGRSDRATESAGLDDLEERFAAEEFDLVAVGRALISNPDWVLKVYEGRSDEMRPYDRRDLKTLH